jgi:long-chain acyl-CoA synthetase
LDEDSWEEELTSIISGERRISYPEIHARIARAAAGFRALGLDGGVPVGMMLRNDFAFFEVSGGAAALGSPVVPINWHLKAEEVAYILADSGAKILVCHADLLPQIRHGLPADVRLLVVATPPEIADAFSVSAALTKVPDGMTDWDIWRDTHAPLPVYVKRPLPWSHVIKAPSTGASPGSLHATSAV